MPSAAGRAVSSAVCEVSMNLGPLRAEGTTETRLIAAITSQIMRIGPTKSAILFEELEPTDCPAKIACRVLRGILTANIANAMERLSSAPVVTSVADIPDATPLLMIGVAFMIELMFGATNIPPPAPASTIGTINVVGSLVPERDANKKKAAADTIIPALVKPRAPYLSDRNPLIDPNVTKATANGISRTPAVK